jgi:hypothetical protein
VLATPRRQSSSALQFAIEVQKGDSVADEFFETSLSNQEVLNIFIHDRLETYLTSLQQPMPCQGFFPMIWEFDTSAPEMRDCSDKEVRR